MLEVAQAQLLKAREADSGRSAATVFHGDVLTQTVLALAEGWELAEHENPGEATLRVLIGHVKLTSGDQDWEAVAGELLPIPPARHRLTALQDSAVLLTVGRR
jgi:quercetin dioxygenase-like cupin family protein